jgi:probable HAF family extracellular repeat protein
MKPHYTVQDLGTLGGTFSTAWGMSKDGWLEGFSTLPGDAVVHAFIWRKGVMVDLGTLGGPNSYAEYRPNEDGAVGGASETTTLDPNGEDFCGLGTYLICLPFLWRNGVMTPLPLLGGNNGFGAGVNDLDEVAGSAENSTPEPSCNGTNQVLQVKPVIWRKGKVHELPTYAGDPIGVAHAINNKGQAAGNTGTCTASLHALLWQNGRAIDLGNLGGTMWSRADDINDQGQVVGWSDLPGDTSWHAYIWQRRRMTDLGTLSGDVSSYGKGVNSSGWVVGGSVDVSGNERAFLWQNGMMTDLNTLIDPNSPLYLMQANSISDRGQIAGYAVVISSGEVHAFLATPSHGKDVSEGAAPSEPSQRPTITVPESVRKLLERQARFGGYRGGLVTPQ